MNHEHDPNNSQRHEQDQHVPKRQSDPSGPGSPPAHQDPFHPGLHQHQQDDHSPDQPPLPGLHNEVGPPLIGLQYSGPTPHSSEIQKLNNIRPGMGNRIMDDAHDDIIHDREISKESFEYVIWESKARLYVAISLTCLSFVGIFVSLIIFEPPESLVGAGLCGFGAVTPIVLNLLNTNSTKKKPPHKQNDQEEPDTPSKSTSNNTPTY